jgi:hypothetical protein
MYADPQSVTINAVATSLPRVGSPTPNRVGNFASTDGNIMLSVHQNQTANRCRREFRLTQKKIAADPISAVNKEVSASVIIVVDSPKVGFTSTELGYLTTALKAAFTDAQRDKLLGGEL